MVVLAADLATSLHPLGPGDDARVGRAAVELVALPHLERGVERHRPPVGVVVVGVRPAQLVELRQVLRQVVRDPVGELVLVDRPVRAALAGRAVVRHDDHQGVVELVGLLQVVQQPADVVVGVGQEARVHLGHPREQALLVGREGVPGAGDVQQRERLPVWTGARLWRADRVDRRQLRVGRDDAQLLLTGQDLLADRLVAQVEAAGELLDPRPSAPGAVHVPRPARSRGRTACPGRSPWRP